MKNENLYKNLIIAHRGIHNNKDIPENSLLAFKESIKYNFPIELDIQLTKDNVLIVFHDNNLKRMTSYNKNIKNITYTELNKLTLLDTKEKIPTLKEVLTLVNGKVLLDIEIKNTKRIKETCSILMNELNSYPKNYIIKSFNPKIVKHLKKTYPNVTNYGLLISTKTSSKSYNLIAKIPFLIPYCKPDFIAVSKKILNKPIIKYYRKKLPTFIWTITSKKELEKYKEEDYSYICNNLPYSNKN